MKKIIAFYLPQYHSFKENDEWWGAGFTEWDNVKKGKPLFQGHIQPREPLNDNYYCLLDPEVQKWQVSLAKKHGVYGFCYYHYWFNGKLLMESPLENMLNNSEVDIPFCLAWANESWTRTWDGDAKTCLIAQEYGGLEEWKKHIDYLIRFFNDERYIKVDNKPMLLLYSASRIEKCEEMISFWEDEVKKIGYSGLYVVEMLNFLNKQECLNRSSAVVLYEPNYTREINLKKKDIISKIKRYVRTRVLKNMLIMESVDETYKHIEKRVYCTDKVVYEGTFNDWDNTGRKGHRGAVWIGASPDKFEKHLSTMLKKKETGDFFFVNAWNEWGESAYLEPDKYNGYAYLEAIRNAQKQIES